ncbi:hypothetical protein T439DRAFT_329861 [Meredithblackwellia eburnea MCA 4105]
MPLLGPSYRLTPEDRNEWLGVYFLTGTLVLEPVSDVDALENKLKTLLRTPGWNYLAARLQFDEEKELEHVFTPSTETNPVTYTIEKPGGRLADHPVGKQLPVKTSAVSFHRPLTDVISLFQHPDTASTLTELLERGDYPPCAAHVTSFDDATLVGFTLPHNLGDIHTLSIVMKAWLEGPPAEPVWTAFGKSPLDDALVGLKDDPTRLVCGYRRIKGPRAKEIEASYVADIERTGTIAEEEERMAYIPRELVVRLRKEADEELDATKGEWVSEHDLIVAWILKTLNPSLERYSAGDDRPLSIIQHLSTRKWSGNVFKGITYLGNGLLFFRTSHPFAWLRTQSTARVAYNCVRGGIKTWGKPEEVLRYYLMTRTSRELKDGTSDCGWVPPVVSFTSWAGAGLGSLTKDTRWGCAIMKNGNKEMPKRYIETILSKDRDGGYYVGMIKTKKQWEAIDEEIAFWDAPQ